MSYKNLASFLAIMLGQVMTAQIVQISIPKSGTHLLNKCLKLLADKDGLLYMPNSKLPIAYYAANEEEFNYLTTLPTDKFWFTHLMYTEDYALKLNTDLNSLFFIYRDPRDQVVSFAYYIMKNSQAWPKAKSLTFDQLLMDLICAGNVLDNHPPARGVHNLYQKYLPWMKVPGVYSVKFEDLVGPQGGGDQQAQFKVLKEIALHIGLTVSDARLREIGAALFGAPLSQTFRDGQIGSWKKHFKKQHVDAFKREAGQLLIDLGYEKDLNW